MALKLSGESLHKMLNAEELIGYLERGFKNYTDDLVINPLRVSIEAGGDWWGVMPAYNRSIGFSVKSVCVLPDNQSRGLPTTRAITLLFNPVNGDLEVLADGTVLTAIRTAASSTLALRYTHTPADVFFIGTGMQARYHAKLLSACFRLNRVNAHSRDKKNVDAFLSECRTMGLNVDTQLKAQDADTLIVATTSTSPVIQHLSVANRALVSVGAPTPHARELGDGVLTECSAVVVDTAAGCMKEAGDIVQTIRNGSLSQDKIVELGTLIKTNTHLSVDKVLYKSVGSAFMDLYACEYFYRKALELGVGDQIDM
jgi:alanine dehydrogenase